MSARDERGPGRRVLIVDDNVDLATMWKVLLQGEGYLARTAHDGAEALRVAIEFLPDVVLLDLTMPGMTGQEVAAELRANDTLAGVLIVAISGYADQGVPPGFDGLLVKPADVDDVIALLASHADRRVPSRNDE